MKTNFYTLLLSLVALLATSCGGGSLIAKFSTEEAYHSGDHKWFIKFCNDDAPLTIVPTDCDTLFKTSMVVTLELAEKVELPQGMVAEFKDMYLKIYDTSVVDKMYPTEESHQLLRELLAGEQGDRASITFVSEEGCSKASIKADLEDRESFYIANTTFTSTRRVPTKELFKAFFGGATIDSVIDEYEDLVDDLEDAYDCYDDDDESVKKLNEFREAYRIVEAYTSKIQECIDISRLSNSQEKRIMESYEVFDDIMW